MSDTPETDPGTAGRYTRQQARAAWRRIMKDLRGERKAAAAKQRTRGGAAVVS